MDQFEFSLVTSLDHMKSIGPAWNELLRNSQADTIFLTWEWQYSWAETFLDGNRKLFVLAVFQGGKLVGLAPWYIKKLKTFGLPTNQICFLGNPEAGSDYLDVIISRGREKEITVSIYNYLLSRKHAWDIMLLKDIPADSKFLLHFLELINEDGKHVEISCGSYCPILALPRDRNEFLQQLTPNRRQQYKRHTRLLEKEENILLHSNVEPVPSELDDFFAFYDDKTIYDSKRLSNFIQNLTANNSSKDLMSIDTLYAGDKKIASLMHLKYQQSLFMYLMVIDKEYLPKISIGNIVVGKCIEKSIESGSRFYDFLKGTENYKFHWANSTKISLNLTFYNKNISSILNYFLNSIKIYGKIILR